MDTRRKSQQGFTMLELMIVIAIIGVLVVPVMYLEIQLMEQNQGGIYRRELAETGARVYEQIAHDVRWSAAVPDSVADFKQAPDSLLLQLNDGSFAVYTIDREQAAITRKLFAPDQKTIIASDLIARDVRAFEVTPDTLTPPRIFTLRIDLHRELLSIPIDLDVKAIAVRRLP